MSFSFPKGPQRQQWLFAGLTFLFAWLALRTPLQDVSVGKSVGGWLMLTAVLVFVQGFQRANPNERSSARVSALITFIIGFLFASAQWFQDSALVWLVAFCFVADGLYHIHLFSQMDGWRSKAALRQLLGGLASLLVAAGIFFFKGESLQWLVAASGALRIAGMGLEILSAKPGRAAEIDEDVFAAMRLPDQPEMHHITQRITQEEASRAAIDRRWIISFLLILFFMHLGRMGFDRSAWGILSPGIALLGDIVVALIIAFFVILPMRSGLRSIVRPLERRLWQWVLQKPRHLRAWYDVRNPVQAWLERRLRLTIRGRKAGYSLPTAMRTGLQTGLPFAALLATIIPVFGMSWYFDTENWAAGIWDGWAAARTDDWRTAMVKAVEPQPTARSFNLQPQGLSDTADFSFVVIGDPGEGDASQYILHDQILRVSEKPDVKFVLISSDVVYPDGAMKDYEKNFWLPMHGVRKPVYAIPGNHDWYDALDGFAATFFTPEAAGKAMRARREADLKITSTTEQDVDDMLAKAAAYRKAYQVPTGFQQAPFFQIQTKDFALITIETGVLRRIDDTHLHWLEEVLKASQGKFIMAVLGHPFYAIGEYQGSMNPDFTALHQLLRRYNVQVVMAGDTHDLEYYEEPLREAGSTKKMYHFVNGGGGAYLSLGAALKPYNEMPQKVWAHYPAKEPLVAKIEQNNGWAKRPFWKWTKLYNGWPFSAEWLSAAFDYNVSPFFQSFMQIHVERSKRQVRLVAYTAYGPLTWAELAKSAGVKPAGAKESDAVEWVFPM